MKKLTKILLPFLVLSSAFVSGCGKDKEDNLKINLSYGDIHTEKVTEIIGADLYQKIHDDKENLLMVVSAEGCTCWEEFEPIINKYIKENRLICYHVSYSEFSSFAPSVGLVLNKSTTTFAIYENGELKFNVHTDPENKTMSDYKTFKTVMDDTISMPHCYFVNIDDVDKMMASDKTEVIYFERSGCPDCTYANKTILKDYVYGHQDMKNLYILDCQYWIDIKKEDENAYKALKNKYGLSEAINPDYGYGEGSFPFFSLIENGKWTAGADAFNQSVEKVGDKVKVTSSYYSEARVKKLKYLDGLDGVTKVLDDHIIPEGKYSEKEYEGVSYYSWDKADARNYYEPLVTAFLKYSLEKVTYTF